MGLSDEDRRTVVEMERAKARRFLAQAEMQRVEGELDMAVNRYYYACFHIAQALLISSGLSAKTHQGLIRVVSDNFIKTGKLPTEYGSFLSRLMNLRQKADYNCMFCVGERDVETCTAHAARFIDDVEGLIG